MSKFFQVLSVIGILDRHLGFKKCHQSSTLLPLKTKPVCIMQPLLNSSPDTLLEDLGKSCPFY